MTKTAKMASEPSPPQQVESEPTSTLTALMNETPLSATRLARERDLDASTISRWIMHGVKGRAVNGVRPTIQLEAYRIGGRIYTSPEAFERFVARLNSEDTAASAISPPATRAPAQRARAAAEAGKLAEAMGA